jgi:tetratricopeptide (TPR) repeat protein
MRIFVTALLLSQILGPVKERETREGNERYQEGKLDEALQSYTQAQVDHPESPELHYNIGNVQFRKKDAEKALEEYRAAEGGTSETARRASFNSGNVHYLGERWKEAVGAYSDALRIDPTDIEARQNLELALQKLKEQEKQKPPPQGGGGGEAENKEGGDDKTQKSQDPEKDPTPTPKPEESTGGEEGASPEPAKMSQEEAERILEALAQIEQAQQMEQQKKQKARARGKGKIW